MTMAIRVYDNGSAYSVSIGEAEIRGFCLGRPACGLDKLRGLWVQFAKDGGDMVDLWIKGTCVPAQLDAAALTGLVDGMKRHAEAKLGIDPGGDNWRVDWERQKEVLLRGLGRSTPPCTERLDECPPKVARSQG